MQGKVTAHWWSTKWICSECSCLQTQVSAAQVCCHVTTKSWLVQGWWMVTLKNCFIAKNLICNKWFCCSHECWWPPYLILHLFPYTIRGTNVAFSMTDSMSLGRWSQWCIHTWSLSCRASSPGSTNRPTIIMCLPRWQRFVWLSSFLYNQLYNSCNNKLKHLAGQ